MALVRNPLYAGAASGSVGSVTYQRGRSGAVARNRVLPVKSRSSKATIYRADTFGFVLSKWQGANPISTDAWVEFSTLNPVTDRFGHRRKLSAFNWFMKLNLAAVYYHDTFDFFPPESPTNFYYPSIDIQFTASGFALSWSPPIPAGQAIVVFQYRTLRLQKLSHRSLVQSHTFLQGDTSPQLVTPAPGGPGGPGTLPPFQGNTWVQFEVFTVSNAGQKSPVLFFNLQAV